MFPFVTLILHSLITIEKGKHQKAKKGVSPPQGTVLSEFHISSCTLWNMYLMEFGGVLRCVFGWWFEIEFRWEVIAIIVIGKVRILFREEGLRWQVNVRR